MEYLPVLVFAFSTAITPGPNNLMLMSSGLNYGFRKSIPHILGVCFGLCIMVFLIGTGLGAIFEKYPLIHLVIKTIGILYLLYLAWCIARASRPKTTSGKKKPFTFFQAFAFQWVNPKAWVIFIGAIAAFTNPEIRILPQVIFIAVALLIAGLFAMSTWLWFGASMASFIQTDKHRHYFNYGMATLLVISIVPMALSEL